jgi:hypothetical protein
MSILEMERLPETLLSAVAVRDNHHEAKTVAVGFQQMQ